MSYSANQYNYATPLSSSTGLIGESQSVVDKKYFLLSNNTLDGSYYPVSGDVGLWGAALSDASGILTSPFVVTVEESLTVNAFRLIGSQYCYPVAFTVQFYNSGALLYTIAEAANNKAEYIGYLPKTLIVDKYIITVTKVSSANSPVRLLNAYNPAYVKRVDTMHIANSERSALSSLLSIISYDALNIKHSEVARPTVIVSDNDNLAVLHSAGTNIHANVFSADSLKTKYSKTASIQNTIDVSVDNLKVTHHNTSHIHNTINVTRDTLKTKPVEGISHVKNTIDVTRDTLKVLNIAEGTLSNIHSIMKSPFRQIHGRVFITYTDPMLDDETVVEASSDAYNSNRSQILDGISTEEYTYFTLYDNDLSGNYHVSDEYSQVGWVSSEISNSDGVFDNPPSMTLRFASRPIVELYVVFDTSHGSVARDFTVTFTKEDLSTISYDITDNEDKTVSIVGNDVTPFSLVNSLADIVAITITVRKLSKAYAPAAILDMPVSSTILYKGYSDVSDLISIDLLEELTYEDAIEALGGVSANEVTVVLDNSSKEFFFNRNSVVSRQLKRNRKIVPWLGAEIIPGQIEWYTLGTFWAYKWDVPANGLTASVVGFDTIGLLSTTDYINHSMQIGKSIGFLIEYILNDAKQSLDFIEYYIDESLYDIVIPYAWFEHSSHAAALRKLSLCYPLHIYCDRSGRICALPQKLHLDYYYDTWADDTNVIDKNYSSLYTTLPNIVNVTVNAPVVVDNEELTKDESVVSITSETDVILNFSKPYLSGIHVTVDCDNTVSYTYEVHSWGIIIAFSGSGYVRSIVCTGTCVDIVTSSVITRRDDSSVRLNGAVTRDVKSDFIQTSDHAKIIIDRLFSLSEYDKYDATVKYRGDIALTINDPILLKDGIAPDNRYNIKRHQLSWNGSLTGSAELNT